MHYFKSGFAALTAMALVLSTPAGNTRAATSEGVDNIFPDPVIATGKGFQIKRSQLDDAYMNYNTSLAASGGSIPEDRRAEVRSNLLQHLILTQILLQKATAADRAEVGKEVDDNIATARRTAPSPQAFDAQIKASGMTLAQVRAKAVDEQICKTVIQRATTNGIQITDAAAKKFYDENPDKFQQPDMVRVSHILVSTIDPVTQTPLSAEQKKAKLQLAESLRDRAKKGEDFVTLVEKYSDDPGSKEKKGEYKFARHQMVPEFEAAAFSMKEGQISDPVETRYGYHVIKLLEKIPARHEEFSEVKQKIKDYLLAQEAQKLLPAYLDKIRSEADVALLDPDTGKPLSKPVK
jgi:peptidyl-prolyl cis-trans isomerase C